MLTLIHSRHCQCNLNNHWLFAFIPETGKKKKETLPVHCLSQHLSLCYIGCLRTFMYNWFLKFFTGVKKPAAGGTPKRRTTAQKRKLDDGTKSSDGTGSSAGEVVQASKRQRLNTDPRSAYTVFISNLPMQMDLVELNWYLDQRHAVPLRIFWRGNRTFAFLVYRNPAEAHLALHRLRNMRIKGRKIFMQLSRTNTLGRFHEVWEAPVPSHDPYRPLHIHHYHYIFQ